MAERAKGAPELKAGTAWRLPDCSGACLLDRRSCTLLHPTGRVRAPCLLYSKLYTNFSCSLNSLAAQRLPPRALAGVSNGTSQMSRAYSPMARSDENHAMWATLSMHIRVQSADDSQSLSIRRWVAT